MSVLFRFRSIVPFGLIMLPWILMAADDPSAHTSSSEDLPMIPAAELSVLKSAGESFMREFSASQDTAAYRASFEGLFTRFAADKSNAAAMALKWGAETYAGQIRLKDEIGTPEIGKFVYVGARRIGARLLKLAYYRQYSQGPLPVVLIFNKMDQDWTISQVAMGESTAGTDIRALWVQETPVVIRKTIPDFPALRAATDECMIQGETRSGVEALVKRYAQNSPNADRFIEQFVKGIEGRPAIGKSLGYELIGTARQSDSLCKLVYAWRFEKRHAPFTFMFYKNTDGWVLASVNLFDNATPDLTATTVSEPAR
jgi:hypothetical protein